MNTFAKAKEITIPDYYFEVLRLNCGRFRDVRELIGHNVSMLHHYARIKPKIEREIKSHGGWIRKGRTAQDIGSKVDQILKNKDQKSKERICYKDAKILRNYKKNKELNHLKM